MARELALVPTSGGLAFTVMDPLRARGASAFLPALALLPLVAIPFLVPRSAGGVAIVAMLAAMLLIGGWIVARARIPWDVVELRAEGIVRLQAGGRPPSRDELAAGLGERALTVAFADVAALTCGDDHIAWQLDDGTRGELVFANTARTDVDRVFAQIEPVWRRKRDGAIDAKRDAMRALMAQAERG